MASRNRKAPFDLGTRKGARALGSDVGRRRGKVRGPFHAGCEILHGRTDPSPLPWVHAVTDSSPAPS